MTDILWEHQDNASDHVTVPRWINNDISAYDIAAILQGGCASGAYMPAVTYFDARNTMNEHGDDILDYIQLSGACELPAIPDDSSWSGIAVHYLSYAVELWASSVAEELADALESDE